MPQETVETTTDEELEPGVWTRNEEGELVPDYESTFPTINEGEVVLGVRGFLPASLVDIRRVQDLDEFLGKELRCKVIELNRSRNNVVLSRRAVLEDERKEMRQAILDRLQPGDVVEGQISNIVDFGAFVDLDGMDGLIHISELSWSHVNHPSEVLEIGQNVKVKGLVHISELAQHHVENPREVVAQGDPVNVLILEVDADRRRLSLSLKRVEEGSVPRPRADDEVKRAVVERFGPGVLDGSGAVDRTALGRVVFADRAELEWLEGLLHPRVVREYAAWREELGRRPDPPPAAGVEGAPPLQTGGETRLDQ